MPEKMTKYRRGGKIVGYKGADADSYQEPTAPKAGGVADLEQTGATPMPKQADYDSTAKWSAALRKWRENQRSSREAAGALAKNTK